MQNSFQPHLFTDKEPQTQSTKKTVLIIDENLMFLSIHEAIVRLLKKETEVTIMTTSSPEQALFISRRYPLDLIITGQLSKMSDKGFLSMIKKPELNANTPVLIAISEYEAGTHQELIEQGATECVEKNANKAILLNAARSALKLI